MYFPKHNKWRPPYLEGGLQVVFVALGEELVGVGCRSVLVEVLQVLQVGSEVLLSVATGSCEDELGLQLKKDSHSHKQHLYWLVRNLRGVCWLIPWKERRLFADGLLTKQGSLSYWLGKCWWEVWLLWLVPRATYRSQRLTACLLRFQ